MLVQGGLTTGATENRTPRNDGKNVAQKRPIRRAAARGMADH